MAKPRWGRAGHGHTFDLPLVLSLSLSLSPFSCSLSLAFLEKRRDESPIFGREMEKDVFERSSFLLRFSSFLLVSNFEIPRGMLKEKKISPWWKSITSYILLYITKIMQKKYRERSKQRLKLKLLHGINNSNS